MSAEQGEPTLSTIIIEELDGQKRRLVLRGGALPHQGAAWKSSLQVLTTWYPGNPEATQQVLGARELPSQWSGSWSRTVLGRYPSTLSLYPSKNEQGGFNDENIVSPWKLRDVVEDMFRAGSRLRVAWQQVTRAQNIENFDKKFGLLNDGANATEPISLVRTGRATEWEFQYTRSQDIDWNITFAWSGRGIPQNRVAHTRQNDVAAGAAEVMAMQKSLIAATAGTFTLGQLVGRLETLMNDFKRAIQRQMNSLEKLAGIVNKLRNTPFEVANMFVDIARNTVAIVNQFHDEITRSSPEQNSLDTSVTALLNSSKSFGKTFKEQQSQLARVAKIQEVTFQAMLSNNPGGLAPSGNDNSSLVAVGILAVHVVKEGETPMGISSKYYATPDMAQLILKTNHLPWNTIELEPGTVLVIPVLP